jgi:hypothetical protein
MGYGALTDATTASNNTAVGRLALGDNTTGANNTAFSTDSLRLNTTGSNNSSFGANALRANTTGSVNTALGAESLRFNTTASYNTAVGYGAGGTYNSTLGSNTYVGYQAGYSSSGDSNTFVGARVISTGKGCGQDMTTGSYNTILGAFSGNQGGLDIRTSSNNIVLSDGGGNPRLWIDSGGDLALGTNFNPHNSTNTGVAIYNDGYVLAGKSSDAPIYANRITNDGSVIVINKNGTTIGNISVATVGSAVAMGIGHSDSGLYFDNVNNCVSPFNINTNNINDDFVSLGVSSARFDNVFATNGTIQTSDRNEKQDIEELTDAEKRVAVVAKGLMRKYRWKSAVAEKGDNARTHFGIIAQDLQDAFTAESLDASKYAMFCSDTWWEKEITVDAVEADEENGIEAKDAYTYIDTKEEATEGYTEKTRLGVRYNQLLAFIISAI